MKEEKIIIEFKYPWTMMPLENAEEWINAVKGSLTEDDPLYKKEIFVSGRHEYEQLLLVENDSDDNYAIVSVMYDRKADKLICKTIEVVKSVYALKERLENDHQKATARFK
jgi:uncharacterized Fe-S cluster-containing protein